METKNTNIAACITATCRFIDEVSGVGEIVGFDGDLEQLRGEVAIDAFSLICSLLEQDGAHADEDLVTIREALGGLVDEEALGLTASEIRASGVIFNRNHWTVCPRMLGKIVATEDDAKAAAGAWTYYFSAMALAHEVVAMESFVERDTLEILEEFRSCLLTTLEGRGIRRASSTLNGVVELSDVGVASLFNDDAAVAIGEVPNKTLTNESRSSSPFAVPPSETPAKVTNVQPAELVESERAKEEALTSERRLDELLGELDALVGLESVKFEIHLTADLMAVQRLRQKRGLKVPGGSKHLVFTGNPGTGKTTVARLLAEIYHILGVVSRGHLVEVDRSGLVAGFVGQTAGKVKQVFESAMGGVLLVDEAYALVQGGEKDYGVEAISTLVKLVEDHRENIVVILTGYPGKMEALVSSNSGMASRFPRTIHFGDYSNEELIQIFVSLCEQEQYSPTPEALEVAKARFDVEPRGAGFGNGRLARNLFEAATGAQASRVVKLLDPSDNELMELTEKDLIEAGKRI